MRTHVALQIKSIREQRGISRPAFAKMLGKAPSWVFRLEDPNQSPPTIPTLLEVAEVFDVDLHVAFGPFSTALRRIENLSQEDFEVPSFSEEFESENRPSASGLFELEEEAIADGKLVRMTVTTADDDYIAQRFEDVDADLIARPIPPQSEFLYNQLTERHTGAYGD